MDFSLQTGRVKREMYPRLACVIRLIIAIFAFAEMYLNKKGISTTLLGLIGILTLPAQTDNILKIDEDIQLIHLQDSAYVHVTWDQSDSYGRFSSNGMILVKNGKALMIDTPMDNEKTKRLTRYLKETLSVEVTKLVIGHFHDDCLGGLGYLQSVGVESIANILTIEKCKKTGLPVPSTSFEDSLIFDFYGEHIECRYFGPGHSPDNITVWIPGKKILFGGCLIKSIDSRGLGNLSDAVVPAWDVTVKNLMKKYTNIKTVVPGHGNIGGIELLSHTIELVEKEKNR